jgi:hypothetical protein
MASYESSIPRKSERVMNSSVMYTILCVFIAIKYPTKCSETGLGSSVIHD